MWLLAGYFFMQKVCSLQVFLLPPRCFCSTQQCSVHLHRHYCQEPLQLPHFQCPGQVCVICFCLFSAWFLLQLVAGSRETCIESTTVTSKSSYSSPSKPPVCLLLQHVLVWRRSSILPAQTPNNLAGAPVQISET